MKFVTLSSILVLCLFVDINFGFTLEAKCLEIPVGCPECPKELSTELKNKACNDHDLVAVLELTRDSTNVCNKFKVEEKVKGNFESETYAMGLTCQCEHIKSNKVLLIAKKDSFRNNVYVFERNTAMFMDASKINELPCKPQSEEGGHKHSRRTQQSEGYNHNQPQAVQPGYGHAPMYSRPMYPMQPYGPPPMYGPGPRYGPMPGHGSPGYGGYVPPMSGYNEGYEAPKYETPKYETPMYEAPKYETPKYETPKYETPKYEAPKYEAPKYEAPKYEMPKYEEPKYDYKPPQYGNSYEAPKSYDSGYNAPNYGGGYAPPTYQPNYQPMGYPQMPYQPPMNYGGYGDGYNQGGGYNPGYNPPAYNQGYGGEQMGYNQGYNQGSGYGYDAPQYGKHENTYEAPKSYESGYNAPKSYDSYSAPKSYESGYNAPKSYDSYSAPKSYDSYNAPKSYDSGYNAPKSYESYSPPKSYDSGYSAPKSYESYSPPKSYDTYSAPKSYDSGYNAPNYGGQQYGMQGGGYNQPNYGGYDAPQYGMQGGGYNQPNYGGYGAPQYGMQGPSYNAPNYGGYSAPQYGMHGGGYEAPQYPQGGYQAPYNYEAPKYETPKYEAPKYEAPKYEEPKYEQNYGYVPPSMYTPNYEKSSYDSKSYKSNYQSPPSYNSNTYYKRKGYSATPYQMPYMPYQQYSPYGQYFPETQNEYVQIQGYHWPIGYLTTHHLRAYQTYQHEKSNPVQYILGHNMYRHGHRYRPPIQYNPQPYMPYPSHKSYGKAYQKPNMVKEYYASSTVNEEVKLPETCSEVSDTCPHPYDEVNDDLLLNACSFKNIILATVEKKAVKTNMESYYGVLQVESQYRNSTEIPSRIDFNEKQSCNVLQSSEQGSKVILYIEKDTSFNCLSLDEHMYAVKFSHTNEYDTKESLKKCSNE